MSATLLLKLDAPMQAWGAESRFVRRQTRTEPTKSGVVGLLAAALGRSREADISDLAALRFGVRTDQIGAIERCFQTEVDWRSGKAMPLTERFYLSDYKFVAGVEGPREQIELLAHAVNHPVYPLFLGRRSCPPGSRIGLPVVEHDLRTALATTPWTAALWYRKKQRTSVRLTIALDAQPGAAEEYCRDQPVSFQQSNRVYQLRGITREEITVENPDGYTPAQSHDPFALLGEQ
ncbi:type I-E CRISPR-associated protein Cas5/CasD [Corynebacterium choanae]|uniref:CRISPR-associated protein n=1 Tax=Corynebacterium choanae TaxID=1862358 RepID=A0A3G6J4B9_9CORY|nr:type I-E CRISPR-associated protein Cas5/CasD [Corynebacterium choanae]AZA12563.1 CRISPR-associated protein [Corynebacterium choanae]